MMQGEFTKDVTYQRVYGEINRRSEAQEKATQFNIVAVGGLFTWLLSQQNISAVHPAYFLLIAIINFALALKWLSEDKSIEVLFTYLKEIGAPLETWQGGKFYALYSKSIRLGDFLWRFV